MTDNGDDAAGQAKLAPIVLHVALALALIGATARILEIAPLDADTTETALFVVSILVLPLLAAGGVVYALRPRFDRPAGLAETIIVAAAVFGMAGLGLLVILAGVGGLAFARLPPRAEIIADVSIGAALAALIAAAFGWGRQEVHGRIGGRRLQSHVLIVTGFFFIIAIHGIDPGGQRFVFPLNILLEPALPYRLASFAIGLVFAAAILKLTKYEAAALDAGSAALSRYQRGALIAAAILTVVYFDFGIPSELFHYLVNISPALAVLSGRVVLVDAFSQYGLGPIVTTVISFSIGPHTHGNAGVLVQLHHLVFYAVWLACLTRMTRFKLAATAIGFVSIGLLLALFTYGGQHWNLNFVPSLGGFRFLPMLLMVLALSLLPPGHRFSVWTVLAAVYSAFWSLEALIASLGIHWGLIGLLGIRDRNVKSIAVGAALSILPAIATITLITCAIFVSSGRLPQFGMMLSIMKGVEWLKPSDADFFGWIAPLVAMFVTMALGWAYAISGNRSQASDNLIYRFIPMTLLAAVMSFYFVGRSFPAVLAIATLPLIALVIPGLLELISRWSRQGRRAWGRLAIPLSITAWIAAVTAGALIPPESDYRLVLQECRDHGNCSPGALLERIRFRIHQRPSLEVTGQTFTDMQPDIDGVVADTVNMIEKWGADQPDVTLLLGPIISPTNYELAAEVSLMYTGKWHTWPRTLTRMDEFFYPSLRERIVTADVQLPPGALVVARKNRAFIAPFEREILSRIEARWDLCPLPDIGRNVAAFRIADKGQCAALPPAAP